VTSIIWTRKGLYSERLQRLKLLREEEGGIHDIHRMELGRWLPSWSVLGQMVVFFPRSIFTKVDHTLWGGIRLYSLRIKQLLLVPPRGWTDNELGLEWVEKNFDRFTKDR
jgi:hypothetical protein